VLIVLVSTHIFIDFFSMGMFFLSYATQAGSLLAFMMAVGLMLRKKTITRFDLTVVLFLLLIGCSSLMNGTDWKNWTYISMSVLAYLIVISYYENQYKVIVIAALVVLSVGVYAQLLQCILHPEMWMIKDDKINNGYLLGGNYNQIGIRVLLAFSLGMMSIRYNKWWLLNLIPLLVAGLVVLSMVRSMTSLSCIILFLLFTLIRNPHLLRIGLIGLYTGWLLFQCIVCFSGTDLANNEFALWLVEDVLGKDITFTGRTYMWDAALQTISGSPVWGYGFVDKDWFYSNMSSRAIGAHNFILNTMVYGGVISVLLYGRIMMLSIRHLRTYNDRDSLRLIATFGLLCIMMLFEAYNIAVVFFVLAVMYYYPSNEARDKI